jgi:hypothetical protein
MSPLMPSSVCIVSTAKGIFVGFSLAVPYKYRSFMYKSIFHSLPDPLQSAIQQWHQADFHGLNSLVGNTILDVHTYQLDWRATTCGNFIVQKGLCATCRQMFPFLQAFTKGSPQIVTANYLLHCAEWEAVSRAMMAR